MAIPKLLVANDEHADVNHQFCTKGIHSWCTIYQRAIAEGITPPKHPNYLFPEEIELVEHVFTKYNYNKDFFISQIAGGQTSNHNEAVHSILFSMIPKTKAIGIDAMNIGSALAVIRYNEGYRAIWGCLKSCK